MLDRARPISASERWIRASRQSTASPGGEGHRSGLRPQTSSLGASSADGSPRSARGQYRHQCTYPDRFQHADASCSRRTGHPPACGRPAGTGWQVIRGVAPRFVPASNRGRSGTPNSPMNYSGISSRTPSHVRLRLSVCHNLRALHRLPVASVYRLSAVSGLPRFCGTSSTSLFQPTGDSIRHALIGRARQPWARGVSYKSAVAYVQPAPRESGGSRLRLKPVPLHIRPGAALW